jgi:LysM domain
MYDRTRLGSNEDLIMEVAMSALPAEELTCGSDIRPARALCPVAGPADPRDDTPAIDPDMPGTRRDTPGPQRDTPDIRSPAPRIRRDTPGAGSARRGETPAARRGETPAARRGDAPAAPLRLTRRGWVVVTVAAALLVAVLSLLAAGVAQATNDGPSPRAARHGLVQVVVRQGQSLWSVAENADPGQDTRAVIQQIIDLNSLTGDTVFAGQQLWVPRG